MKIDDVVAAYHGQDPHGNDDAAGEGGELKVMSGGDGRGE